MGKEQRKKREPHSVDSLSIVENAEKRFPDDCDAAKALATFAMTLNLQLEQQGIDQDLMAEDLNISTGIISNYRNGKSEPSLTKLRKIASYLHVDCSYLMTGVSAKNHTVHSDLGLSEEAIQVLRYINNPPEDMNESTKAFNLKTLAVLNLLLGEEEKKMFNGPFGSNENTFKNVFSEMYAYIFMDDKQIKYLGHDAGSVPEFYNTKDLLREMHMAQIRRQLDYLAENKEAK